MLAPLSLPSALSLASPVKPSFLGCIICNKKHAFIRYLGSRCERVAKRATRCALHQGLVAREANVAAAGRDDIEVGGADQQRAELRLAERAKEFREPAMRDVEFQRMLVVTAHLHRYFPFGDFGQRGLHGRPFAPRATLDALAHGGEQLLRPIAQGLP